MTLHRKSIDDLIAEARDGNAMAWDAIVDRYASLVWAVCRSFRLSQADAADVSQTVWLRAVEHLVSLKVAAAFPGWLAAITRNECLRVVRGLKNAPQELERVPATQLRVEFGSPPDDEILAAERRAAIRESFAQLPHDCQRLLALLASSEPLSYAEISATLQIPVGSIGPTRGRCLKKLRNCPALVAWMASHDE